MQQKPIFSNAGGFMDPKKILGKIGIKEKMIIADFGSGPGYFALPLSEMVGRRGRIYAVDILTSNLETIESRAREEGIHNIETVRADLEQERGSKFEDASMDLVVIANILFQLKDRETIFKEAERILNNKGKLAVIDWIPGQNSSFGPSEDIRISETEAQNSAVSSGFKFEEKLEVDKYHYGLLFTK